MDRTPSRSFVTFAMACMFLPFATTTHAGTAAGYPEFEIVESVPVETRLDHPDMRNADEVWLEMIRGARRSLDFAEFYASTEPNSRLEDVIAAIEDAADRGVTVRYLGEKRFYGTYPETIDRLGARDGIETRILDLSERSGGVLHAKYFFVDGEQVFLGSQNFDWRALEHIQEIGVRTSIPTVVRPLLAVFEYDWRLAGPEGKGNDVATHRAGPGKPDTRILSNGDTLSVLPVVSPTGWIPDEGLWDLPRIVELIDSAEREVSVQLLTYRPVSREGEYFADLENALRRAAARGVSVRLLFADWCKRGSTIPYLKSLTLVPGIEVKLVTIPQWSGGFIPYARVVHAKYVVADGRRAWIGTSNWEKGYFYGSRNVGVIVDNGRVGRTLTRFFDDGWSGPYSYVVDPSVEYEVPRIGE